MVAFPLAFREAFNLARREALFAIRALNGAPLPLFDREDLEDDKAIHFKVRLVLVFNALEVDPEYRCAATSGIILEIPAHPTVQ